jgi:hypothetical protein
VRSERARANQWITTGQEFDDSKFAADQVRFQKRQEFKLRAKAKSMGFERGPSDAQLCAYSSARQIDDAGKGGLLFLRDGDDYFI